MILLFAKYTTQNPTMVFNTAEGNCCKDNKAQDAAMVPHLASAKERLRNLANKKRISKLHKQDRRFVPRQAKLDSISEEEPLEPHAGFIENIKSIGKGADTALTISKSLIEFQAKIQYEGTELDDFSTNLLCRIEDLGALLVGISNCSNYASFFSVLHLYLRSHYRGSVCTLIHDLVKGIIAKNVSSNLDHQSGDFEFDDFLAILKQGLSDWKSVRHSDLSKRVMELVNILITFGFFPTLRESPLHFRGFELFRARAWDCQKDAASFAEAVFDTAIFFLERGYLAFKTGDISPLLYDDTEISYIDLEYAKIVACLPLLEAGRLDMRDGDFKNDQEYEVRLEALIAKITSKIKFEKDGPIKTILSNKLLVLRKTLTCLVMAQKQSSVREKPYGVLIYGPSAVGKSSINATLTKCLLEYNGFPSSKEHVVVLNDNDKFQSEYRACHTAVTMDDFGNTRSDHYQESPTNKIIDFLNNVPKAALNPNVELKGNVMIRPKLVTVTTNKKDLMAGTFSNEPVSILRRFETILDVTLKPDYVCPLTGGLAKEKVEGKFLSDAWLIQVQRVKICRTTSLDKQDSYQFETILKDASLIQAIEYMKKDSKTHFAQQKQFVETVESMYDMKFCPHAYPASECPFCLDEHCGDADPAFIFELDAHSDLDEIEASIINVKPFHQSLKDLVSEWYSTHGLSKLEYVKGKAMTLKDALQARQKEILGAVCLSLGISVGIYQTIKMLKKLYTEVLTAHVEEMAPVKKDSDRPNPWKQAKSIHLPRSGKVADTTADRLVTKVERHLAFAYLEFEGRTRFCNIFPMCNNVWLLPGHMLEDDKHYRIRVQSTPTDELGRNFSQLLSPDDWVRVGSDFALVRLVNGGDVPNFVDFLPEETIDFGTVVADIVCKQEDGFVKTYSVKAGDVKEYHSHKASFRGFSYYYPEETRPGMCIAPVIPKIRAAVIAGFHIAGKNNTHFGAAAILNRPDVKRGLEHLNHISPLRCHSAGTFPEEKYGVKYPLSGKLDKKHCANFLEGDGHSQPIVEVIGSHSKGTMTFRSQVAKSDISDLVEEVMGLPRLHGPPNSQGWRRHYNRDLELMTHPLGMFRGDLLTKARTDYMLTVTDFFHRKPELLDEIRPYPKAYVLSGLDDVSSVDRIKQSTSMGWPLNSKKSNFMEETDEIVPGVSRPIDFTDPMFWNEVERMEDVLASGERIYVTHRANMKDEPTKFTKNKIRIFAGCEVAFVCLVRKYFLPIVRVIQDNQIVFECAVGVVAQSREWGYLKEALTKYGDERMIAGDYKAFDKTVTPMIMMSSFEILIRIAQMAGYSDRQLNIMRGCATEISYPVYEYDGVFLQMFGSNPSGHPLTVIINNLNNSQYIRYAYYAMHDGESVPLFNQRVALLCYGDDNAMSVHEEEDKLNHTSIAHELEKVGVTYTMADKDSESVPFIPLSQVSFLKRGFVWNEELQAWLAPLEEASICKSLHNYMKSKGSLVTSSEIAANAIETANKEFFFHGRETFEFRRKQLDEVLDRANLRVFIGSLKTWDDYKDSFNGNFGKKGIENEPSILLDC